MPATLKRRAAAAIVICVVAAIYLLRVDRTVGMMTDDAWYVLLARALSRGEGYWLVNSPLDRVLPGYPPGFPALLSIVFLFRPEAPDNLFLLKIVSILAMLGAGLLSYRYFHRERGLEKDLAACCAIALAVTPALVFLATSTVMSECVFLFAQLAAVIAAHRAVGLPRTDIGARAVVGAAVLAAAALLIRSAGVAVVCAAFLIFLKHRLWKRAFLFAAVAVACVLPWLVHARVNAPTDEQKQVQRGSIVYSYSDQLWMRRAGAALSGRITIAELPDRIATNVADIFGRGAGGLFVPALLRGADESGEEVLSLGPSIGWTFVGLGGTPANIAISLLLASVAVFGYVRAARARITVAEILVPISLGITVLWPWWTFRFVLPLAPFLFFYFAKGLQVTGRVPLARVALLTMIGLNVVDHAGYIAQVRAKGPHGIDWLARDEEVDKTIAWIGANVDRGAVVATTNPALLYLRTGHRTIALDTVTEKWSVWRSRGATHVACLLPQDLPSRWRGPHTLLFRSADGLHRGSWVIAIH